MDSRQIPVTQQHVQNSALIHPLLALAKRQFPSGVGHEAVRKVISRTALLQRAIVIGDAVGNSIGIRFINSLAPRIKTGERQAARHTLLRLHGTGVESGVSEIAPHVDRAELRIGTIVLVARENLIQLIAVAGHV